MYVSLTRVSTGDEPAGTATIVAEEMTAWLRDIDGFEGFLMLTQPGRTLGLTFWSSRDVAELHRAARMEFLERMTSIAGVDVEETLDFGGAFSVLSARAAAARPR